MSWFGNSIVLFVLYRQRASLQPTDYLTFNLAVSDASISVFGYSRGIIEIFNVFQDSSYIISTIWTCQVLPTRDSPVLKEEGFTCYFPLCVGIIDSVCFEGQSSIKKTVLSLILKVERGSAS